MTAERGRRHQAPLDDHSTDDHSAVIKRLLFTKPCAGPFTCNISFNHVSNLQEKYDDSPLTDGETERASGAAPGWQVSGLRVNLVLSDFEAWFFLPS